MQGEAGPNIQRLQDEGFMIKRPLPKEYAEVLEGLSEEELSVLVGVKRRLDEAESMTPPEVGPYREYVVPL